MYIVYWIHYLDHSDPETQGYVGISRNHPSVRFNNHRTGTLNPYLARAINKGAIQSILFHDLTLEEALSKELALRPEDKIGWNIVRGGGMPPDRTGRSLEGTKVVLHGKDRTPAQKQATEVRRAKMKGKATWNKGLTGFKQKPEDVEKRAAQLRGVPKKRVECPYCKKIGGEANMVRWHFENCRHKNGG